MQRSGFLKECEIPRKGYKKSNSYLLLGILLYAGSLSAEKPPDNVNHVKTFSVKRQPTDNFVLI